MGQRMTWGKKTDRHALKRLWRREDGQTTVEYVIVASFVITVFILFNAVFHRIIEDAYGVYAVILSLPIP